MSDNQRPYQVCLYCGGSAPAIEGVKVVDVTPASSATDDVVASVESSSLTPADLRARVLFAVDDTSDPQEVRRAVAAYAAWVGFAGRRLDVACGPEVVSADALDAHVSSLADAGKPEVPVEQVQIGASRDDDLPVVGQSGIDPATVSALRYARRVRFVPAGSASDAISGFLVVAGVRQRGDQDRFPYLVDGTEPVALPEEGTVGLCLDDVRRRAQELRRSRRSDNRDALADKEPLDARRRKLLAASANEISSTLSRLGVVQDEETELWHCPRPSRHTHGDANASMRVVKGRVKCFRCDAERIDSLRLVMDVTSMTVDEAADWLLSDAAFAAPVG
jgi:hypothetical protein